MAVFYFGESRRGRSSDESFREDGAIDRASLIYIEWRSTASESAAAVYFGESASSAF
jgi:hypothetical protein